LLSELQRDPTWEIGIIVQSLIEDSSQIGRFIYDHPPKSAAQINDALIYAGAQLIRLFISYKVIHFDCHLGNVLVVNNDGNIKSFIIDFGLVCVFRSDLQKNVNLDPNVENRWITFSNQMFPRGEPSDPKKIIQNIFLYMIHLDILHLQRDFDPSYTRAQMTDFYNLIDSNNLFEEIYYKYVEISTTKKTSVPHDTFIKQNVKKGNFELIDQPISVYTITFDNKCIPCSQEDCVNGGIAGTVCCLGSCAAGVSINPAIGLGVATGIGATLLSQKMNRGGKKSKKNKKNKKNKKSKRYKRYKTKRYKK
jgi:hypothetical protein